MNAEFSDTAGWAQWVNQSVNGVFPLRRLLGASKHNAVFLTDYKAKNLADAAIKFVRADAGQAKALLAQWGAAAQLAHPHLVRLFEMGRYRAGEHEFVFVVMEYAEQTLAEILRRRALSHEEVRELLFPTLDALTFLHRRHLIHGGVKSSNLLAVDDQLKLASDTLRPAGQGCATADDVWSLGATLVEALTQRVPSKSDPRLELGLPADLPAGLAETVRRCLSPTPADRPTVIDLRSDYKPASSTDSKLEPEPQAPVASHAQPKASAVSQPQPQARNVSRPQAQPAAVSKPQLQAPAVSHAQPQAPAVSRPQPQAPAAPDDSTPTRKRHVPLLAIAALAAVLIAAWFGLRSTSDPQADLQPPVVIAPVPAPAPAPAASTTIAKLPSAESKRARDVSSPPSQPALPRAPASNALLHEVTPDVPEKISQKIQGRVHVTVRVLVDPAGDVTGVLMENPGPSKYFARLADNAAREWQFVPEDSERARVWLVTFVFTRDGVSTRAVEQ